MRSADLHFHLLPGVDDGPANLLDSLELARGAVAEGTEAVVATPHFRFDLGTVDAAEVVHGVCELRAHLAAFRVPLEIRCGAELGHDVVGSLSQYELQLLAQGPPDARWLLVEAPFEGFGADFHAATAELRERGFGVLVAHPERSADATLDGSEGLRRELEAGSLAQLNAQSLTGEHGEEARAAAWRLIDQGLVAVVASDAHGPTRPPALGAARRVLLEAGVPHATAELLVRAAPCGLLQRGIQQRTAVAA
jgi:protein-tyrosine phosphatase